MLTWHQYGRGKAIALTLQDTWQWQMHASIALEDQTHENFWRQMLRWLVDGVPGVVEARTTQERVEPGEAVTVEATVVDKTFVELNDASVTARVTLPERRDARTCRSSGPASATACIAARSSVPTPGPTRWRSIRRAARRSSAAA